MKKESYTGLDFPQKLRMLMTQLGISNAQLAKALHVDPSLVSRWLKKGCGERKAAEHAMAIEKYVLRQRLTSENKAWLSSTIGERLFTGTSSEKSEQAAQGRIAQWLYPKGNFTEEDRGDGSWTEDEPALNPMLVESFRFSVNGQALHKNTDSEPLLSACGGTVEIAAQLKSMLEGLAGGTIIYIFVSSESSAVAVDTQILEVLFDAARKYQLAMHMLVQSANSSRMMSRLISAYMPMLVEGKITLSVIQGTPQTFTISTNFIIPGRAALIATESVQQHTSAVGTLIRDSSILEDMIASFENSEHFARPLMSAYNDGFARNIVEIFFEEYGVPGGLDVIKSGLNPMYITVEHYGEILRKFKHSEEQYSWRYNEFVRFKEAMKGVMESSRFREIISLSKLKEIAESGVCRMPAMYFLETGIWEIDAQDCVNILNGYIHYLKDNPDFQVILLDIPELFISNSCWHIKSNKHIMIHTWEIDNPMMVYSDQLMLIEEFQQHFDRLWEKSMAAGSRQHTIETLCALRDQCAAHIQV